MRRRPVHLVCQSHWDAEVFISYEDTLAIGVSNLALALRLLEEHPEYTFTLDQGCYLEPALRRAPALLAPLVRHLRSGRIAIVGGTWTMPDLNIPCGESFIRNVQRGMRFFRETLKIEVPLSWTIDSFGFPPSFPQLAAGCGFTANVFARVMAPGAPPDFRWRGIDGTELRSVFLVGGYGLLGACPGSFHEFRAMMDDRLEYLRARCRTRTLLCMTGADIAPPEPQLIDLVRQYNDAQGDYQVIFSTPGKYLEAVAAETGAHGELPVVEGDLNPVFTGCYSARIRVKQRNRELETLLLDAEKLSAMDWLAGRGGAAGVGASVGVPTAGNPAHDGAADGDPAHEPPEDLLDAWEPVLFNQFHDIICGSHVDSVYHATLERFAVSEHLARSRQAEAFASLVSRIDTSGNGAPIVVFNTLGHARSEAVEVAVAFAAERFREVEVRDAVGRLAPCDLLAAERFPDGSLRTARILFIARDLPSFGWEVYRILAASGENTPTDLGASGGPGPRDQFDSGWIENRHLRLSFDLWNGGITGIHVKDGGWEAVPAGALANVVAREQDYGNFWQYNGPCKGDARHPLRSRDPLPNRGETGTAFSDQFDGDGIVTGGRARAEFSIGHPLGTGHHATRVRLYAGTPRIDIFTEITNREERVRYRAAFPTTLAGGAITHEIPFGAIERPEGEYPSQSWIDLSKDGHGLALLNRGLPGGAVVDGVLLLSLLKCTALKEGYAEVGGFRYSTPTEEGYEKHVRHSFSYALLPHAGGWREARLWQAGQELATPPRAVQTLAHRGELPARHSLLSLSNAELALTAAKRSREGIVVRVYEAAGRPIAEARIALRPLAGSLPRFGGTEPGHPTPPAAPPASAGTPPLEVHETDLVERQGARLGALGSGAEVGFSFPVDGFGIRTFRIAAPTPLASPPSKGREAVSGERK